ncbi:MAG: hypothetical protein K0A99_00375 [Desulfoarculaceae bacterium]|nr:hypothetical protein [Desulfoarculaceae bacterium]
MSLIVTSKLSEHKPDELIRTSCVRARFLELVGKEVKLDHGVFFMLGLFSLLDAMLDTSMDVLLAKLLISEDISRALVHKAGLLFPYLQLIQFYEAGEWEELDAAMGILHLDEHKIMDFYLEAVYWAEIFI